MDAKGKRAREIMESIRKVLLQDLEPCIVADVPEAQDEYDGYIGGIYRCLTSGADPDTIAEHLAAVERESLGFATRPEALMSLARKLHGLDVRLEKPGGDS